MMDVKVFVLGGSSSGKTCFLYTMAQQMKNGQSGFTFKGDDAGQREALHKRWTSLSEQGQSPDSTVGATLFNFDCAYVGERFASFSWVGYPGGVITGNAGEEEKREIVGKVNALNERLACYNDSLARFRLRKGRTVPVALVVTKGDLLGSVEEFNAAKEFVKSKFRALFDLKADWKVALMRTGLYTPEWGPWKNGDSVIAPYNMHLPVAFVLSEVVLAGALSGTDKVSFLLKGMRKLLSDVLLMFHSGYQIAS